jgi:hypothetical protein
VAQACGTAGISRSAAYEWRTEDESFARDWDHIIDGVVQEAHARLLRDARDDDSAVGVASRGLILRAHMPATFNRGLHLRHQMMELQIEEKRRELATPLIEGKVAKGGNAMLSELEPIAVVWMPHNFRTSSPHLPGFDFDEWCEAHGKDEPLPYQPVNQDGSGLRLPLPSRCVCTTHDGKDGLVVSLHTEQGEIPPAAADDLWQRIRNYNAGLVLLQGAVDPQSAGLQPPVAVPPSPPEDEPPPSPEEHPEDDDPPGEFDHLGGFGRP